MPRAGKRRSSKQSARKRRGAVESLVAYLANRDIEVEYASKQDAAGGEQRMNEHYENRQRIKTWLLANGDAILAAVAPIMRFRTKPEGTIDLFPDMPFLYKHCYLPKAMLPPAIAPGLVADAVLVFLCKTLAAEMAQGGYTFTVIPCGGADDETLEAGLQICIIYYD